MPRRRNPLKQWALTTLALAFLRVMSWLPLDVCRFLGRRLGDLAFYILPRVRNVGLANLDLAYGNSMMASEKRHLLKRVCRHFGTIFFEFSHVPNYGIFLERGAIRVEGLEHVDQEHGALMIAAHIGNWEHMAGPVKHLVGKQFVGVVRPFDDPRFDRVVSAYRSANGFEPLPKSEAGPEVIRLIREGTWVAILVDQSPRTNGVPATFFGHDCWATVAPAMIALRAKAPIHLVTNIRNDDGTYTVRFTPALELKKTGTFREDLVSITQQVQDAIEEVVREHPDQWLWLHRRWKKRPNLEAEWQQRLAKDKRA